MRNDLTPLSDTQAWTQALREGAFTGSIAAVLSTAVLAAASQRENGSPVAAVNAVSHWLWGDEALQEDRATWRHTLTGYVTNHLAAVFWAVLYARLWGTRPGAKAVPQALAGGIATSAVASLVDYNLVPKRFTPGFENRLSRGSTVATFGAIAAGIALGAMLLRSRD